MRCHTAEHLISQKLDNELRPSLDAKLQKHLQRCPFCTSLYQEYQLLQTGLQQLSNPDFPPQLHHLVMTALPKRNRSTELRKFRLSMAAASLCLVLSITAGTLLGYRRYGDYQNLTENESSTTLFGENSLMVVTYDE